MTRPTLDAVMRALVAGDSPAKGDLLPPSHAVLPAGAVSSDGDPLHDRDLRYADRIRLHIQKEIVKISGLKSRADELNEKVETREEAGRLINQATKQAQRLVEIKRRGGEYCRCLDALDDLENSPSLAMKTAALKCLDENQGPQTREALCRLVMDCGASLGLRSLACTKLRGTQDEQTVAVFVSLLKTGDQTERVMAAAALEGTPVPEAVKALKGIALHGQDFKGGAAALAALRGIADAEMIGEMIRILKSTAEVEIRRGAACGLGKCSRPEAIKALLETGLAAGEAEIRAAAAASLNGVARTEVIKALAGLVEEDSEHSVRLAAIPALAGSANPGAIGALVNCLCADIDPDVAAAAARALAGTTSIRALKTLCTWGIGSWHAKVQAASARALQGTTERSAVDWLVGHMLGDGSPKVRYACAVALQRTADPQIVDMLLSKVVEGRGGQNYAPIALRGCADERVISALVEGGLTHQNAVVRRAAALALRSTADEAALEALCRLGLCDSSPDVQRAAAGALRGTKHIPTLDWLNGEGLKHSSYAVRCASAAALVMTEDPPARAALRTLALSDPDRRVRIFCALAIRDIPCQACYNVVQDVLVELSRLKVSPRIIKKLKGEKVARKSRRRR